MARPRDPRRDETFRLWKESDGTHLLKDIADELAQLTQLNTHTAIERTLKEGIK